VPFVSRTVTVRRVSDELWEVVEPLVYRGRSDTFVVPAGFRTDFATVPRPVVWLIPRFGRYTLAAVLHDWLVTDGLAAGVVSARDADGLFRRVLRELDVPPVRRWLMWTGVRWGSAASGRWTGWWRDAPLVLAISVLAAPVVVPPAVTITLALAVYAVVETLVTAALPGNRRRTDGGLRL
jgi:hypothetical protein